MDEVGDASEDVNTTATVVVGGSFTGTIGDDEDIDYIAVDLQAGVEYVINFEGSATGKGTLDDPEILDIRNPDGDRFGIIGDDDDGIGLNSKLVFAPETTGTYYILATTADGGTGTYTVSVSLSSSGDKEKNTVNTAATADEAGTYEGLFEYDEDRDWVSVTLEGGSLYIFELDGIHEGDFGDSYAEFFGVFDSSGSQIFDGTQSMWGAQSHKLLTFEPDTSGTYFVSVGNTAALDPDESYTVTVRKVTEGTDVGEFLKGGTGGDFIYGADGSDQIFAGPGDLGPDQFFGGAGDDVLGGGAGDDRLVGDEVTGEGIYNLDAGFGAGGADVLFGGTGDDTLIGGGWIPQQGKTWVASTVGDYLWGGAGNDVVLAASGDDVIGGGLGNDYLDGWAGDDTIYGGQGGNGSSLNDFILGGLGDDLIFAGGGLDRIEGEGGNDTIFNGGGDDVVAGGTGDDTLWGGPGDDLIWGQEGADTFAFGPNNGADIINDFDVAMDALNLSGVNASFASLNDIIDAATLSEVSGYSGVLIDTGDDTSVFLLGLDISDLSQISVTL
ncbi:MAG: hypothetical protein HWE25_01225 [Alphaproteobacteria bacterium]|nr:hypothetical protein [Alphaproteobacteria bacterium]